jgi:DNA mismatch repair protein MutL
MEDPLTLGSPSTGMMFSTNKKRISEARDLPPRGSLKHKKTKIISVFPQENRIAEIRPIPKKTQDSASTATLETPDSAPGNLPENEIRNLCLVSPLPLVPKKIRVLGQFRKTYIIAENDAGLVLIEQRALHERLIYDTYVESLQKKEVKIQTFKVPLLLELSPQESVLLEQSLVPLALSGFAVSPFGGSTFAVDSIPECLSEDQVEKVVREILDRLALFGKRGQNEEILRDVCQVVSEHASMPYEQKLGQSEMDCLLAQWEELDSPMASIKDLPLLVEFSLQELEKRLRR